MSDARADVPAELTAQAVIHPDGGAEVTLSGVVQQFAAGAPERVAGDLTEYVAERAAADGRPVRVDVQDPDGRWLLVVHPDGTVQEVGSPVTRGRRRRGAPDAGPAAAVASSMVDPSPDAAPAAPDAPPAPDTAPAASAEEPRREAALGPAGGPTPRPDVLPTLDDLLATRPAAPEGPARQGWQGVLHRMTGGVVSPRPGAAELERRSALASVQRSLDGPRTVVVLNPKGGAHKTTATLLIAATFGTHRGGYTLAWDNNETRGTLGWRSQHATHARTAVDLLRDLDRFSDQRTAGVGDLDTYVRSQGAGQFDVLASDEDAASAASIDAEAFTALHRTLSRFYRIMVVDTGNNMRASNWQAAVAAADQLVIVSTVREDTAQSAAWAVDALRATGHADAVRRAVTVLSAPAADVDFRLRNRLHDHFGRLTRTVLDVPHDSALVAGGPLRVEDLAPTTREAWLRVTAAVADGL